MIYQLIRKEKPNKMQVITLSFLILFDKHTTGKEMDLIEIDEQYTLLCYYNFKKVFQIII
jgi:hypothetical protein